MTSEAYAYQLTEAGDPLTAATYLLNANKVNILPPIEISTADSFMYTSYSNAESNLL